MAVHKHLLLSLMQLKSKVVDHLVLEVEFMLEEVILDNW